MPTFIANARTVRCSFLRPPHHQMSVTRVNARAKCNFGIEKRNENNRIPFLPRIRWRITAIIEFLNSWAHVLLRFSMRSRLTSGNLRSRTKCDNWKKNHFTFRERDTEDTKVTELRLRNAAFLVVAHKLRCWTTWAPCRAADKSRRDKYRAPAKCLLIYFELLWAPDVKTIRASWMCDGWLDGWWQTENRDTGITPSQIMQSNKKSKNRLSGK